MKIFAFFECITFDQSYALICLLSFITSIFILVHRTEHPIRVFALRHSPTADRRLFDSTNLQTLVNPVSFFIYMINKASQSDLNFQSYNLLVRSNWTKNLQMACATLPESLWSWASGNNTNIRGGEHLTLNENGYTPIRFIRVSTQGCMKHKVTLLWAERTTKCMAIDYSLQMESVKQEPRAVGSKYTTTRGLPRRGTCSLVTYNRVNVIQDMWASAHLVFGTWAPQQSASLRLGPECRSPAGSWLGRTPPRSLVPVRVSTLEGVYWSSEDWCWGNANGKVKSLQRARKCCLGKAKARCETLRKVKGSSQVPEAVAAK